MDFSIGPFLITTHLLMRLAKNQVVQWEGKGEKGIEWL